MDNKTIIITDCALDSFFHDPDDSLAILYLLKTSKVKAILTTFGNTSEEKVNDSIKLLLKEIGIAAPIVRGAKNKNDSNNEASKFLSKLNAKDYNIASIGPLTNFKFISSNQIKAFKKFYIMGGAIKIRGNVPPFFKTEFNFFKDKEAVQYIFENREIDLIPLDTTRKVYLTGDFVEQFSRKYPLIGKRVRQWNSLNKMIFRQGSNPHDLILAIAITNNELFMMPKSGIKIIKGQTIKSSDSLQHNIYSITNPTSIDRILKKIMIAG